eukprot:931-Pelagococcus_subviridis.AAC.2
MRLDFPPPAITRPPPRSLTCYSSGARASTARPCDAGARRTSRSCGAGASPSLRSLRSAARAAPPRARCTCPRCA